MSNLSTFFPTVTATSLGLGNSANVTFGSVTTGAVTASGPLSGAGFTDLLAAPPAIGSTTRNTGAFTTLNANNGTVTSNTPAFNVTQTINNVANIFNLAELTFNVTAGSSNSSYLSCISISSGVPITHHNFRRNAYITNVDIVGQNGIRILPNGNNGGQVLLTSNGYYAFTDSTTSTFGTQDLFLRRDASGILAQHNLANPQTFRLYNTTDAGLTNFERGFMRWSSNVLQIGTEAGGTGTQRQMQFSLGTVTADTPLLVTQTWNNSSVNFTAFRIDVTNTASQFSGASSNIQEWRVGGVQLAYVLTNGAMVSRGFGTTAGGTVTVNGCFTLAGPAGGVMEVRQGTTPMDVRFFNTASGTNNVNFERANLRWASNEFIIDTAAGGNGTLRGIKIGSATSSLLGFYGATPVDRPATVADPTGGGTIDAEARTAINDIIDRLQELGLIA